MNRYFNTAGPCVPRLHYMLPPERRIPEARRLIDREQYFVVHAARQVGKTTSMMALAENLTAEGRYCALYATCETGQAARGDVPRAVATVVRSIANGAIASRLPEELRPPPPESMQTVEAEERLRTYLQRWSSSCPRPVVLFLDEIDALFDDSLISILRQLRAGYSARPQGFPQSIALIGLRDVRDYKAQVRPADVSLGTASPFNIKVKSLTMRDFTRDELNDLYRQHTDETGQPFAAEALERAWELTSGQPWLVNALGKEVIDEIGVPVPEPITGAHMDEAKERLILERATHLDSLVSKLREPRVRRVMQPMLAGTWEVDDTTYNDDVAYVRDLGLVTRTAPVEVANPIYREVIARVLSTSVEDRLRIDRQSFVASDGSLDRQRLLEEFKAFWTEHGDILTKRQDYHEVAPQLVLMAYLQRVVNGGGYVTREYGIGRGRIDILVRWLYEEPDGAKREQREAIELKVWKDKQADPIEQGLVQLEQYLDRLGLGEGVLVLFDRRSDAPSIAERTRFESATTAKGYGVVVLRA